MSTETECMNCTDSDLQFRDHSVWEGSKVPPVCPSDKNSIKMKMSMEHWWNDTDRGKLKYWERNII